MLHMIGPKHEWDDDSICVHCGLDGAEWWHLHRTKDPESREPMPECTAIYESSGNTGVEK